MVELHRLTVSSAVKHVVASIVAPFGKPIEERPPVPTPDERLAAYKAKRFAKLKRRELRVRAAKGDEEAIKELRDLGLDAGDGVEAGTGQKANIQSKAARSGKGAALGQKGQKLPKGVLPGGQHEVGKIDARAKANKEKTLRLQAKAKENSVEAKAQA